MSAPGVEVLLAVVLGGHENLWGDDYTLCRCGVGTTNLGGLRAHVAAEQVKALGEWAGSDEVVMRAAEQVHVGECGCELGPDDMHVDAANAVLTAIFGSPS